MKLFNVESLESKSDNSELVKLKREISKLNDMLINSDNEKTVSYLLGRGLIDLVKGREGIASASKSLKLAYVIVLRNKLKKDKDLRFIEKLSIPFLNLDLTTIINIDGRFLQHPQSKNKREGSKNKIKDRIVENIKSTEIKIPKRHQSELKNTFSQALTLLDPISEECWSDAFEGFGLVKTEYEKQIEGTKSDFAFFESAWKANKGQWLYAFNSPKLQHDNAQKLLDSIGKLRAKKIPIIFWNKEDPMHYDMFKPIAKEADYIFTTDAQIVDTYKKDLNNNNVWPLPFAAPVRKTNPINRFERDSENICFAGTYYAKNHLDRKKQMDMLLPTLLDNRGVIYDRASNDSSGNYKIPSQYKDIVREGVDFDEMIELYKKFKIFLNVNTITNSTTMMSRRVYELLASGTPVVSTPSKAITEQFPGIVLTCNSEEEAGIAVKNLLDNHYFWYRQSVLGIREIISKHTYEIRWQYMKSLLTNQEFEDEEFKNILVIANYTGLMDLETFIQNIYNQNKILIKNLIVIDNKKKLSSSKKELLVNKYEGNLLFVNTYSTAIKEIEYESYSFTYFTEDTVINFQNAIYDLLLATKYNKVKAVTRKLHYSFSDLDKNISSNHDFNIDNPDWYSYVESSPLKCLLVNNNYLSDILVEATSWNAKCLNNSIYMIDPFNIVILDKLQKGKIYNDKCISDFIYKFNSRLGI